MGKIVFAALVSFSFCVPAMAVEPSPAERLRHVESSIYWRERSYERAESARQERIADQVGVNDVMRWRAYASSPAGGTVYYRPPLAYEPSIDAAYGVAPPIYSGGVFEPWPYVPGDIYGFSYVPATRVRQPVGQRQLQTGPNRWESFPVYEEDLAAEAAAPIALPPMIPPESQPQRGPRAF